MKCRFCGHQTVFIGDEEICSGCGVVWQPKIREFNYDDGKDPKELNIDQE